MRILVETIRLGYVEDPVVYAADPLYHWERTEKAKWLKEHSYQQMQFNIDESQTFGGQKVKIWAWLNDKNLTYYTLKWGDTND